MGRAATFVLAISLVACGSDTPTPPPLLVTISDPAAYLVTLRCPDGYPWVLNQSCLNPRRQVSSDPMPYRNKDWSHALSAPQISDSYQRGSVYLTTFSYPPHLAFNPPNGDGGDVLVIDGPAVRIAFTQNGMPGGGTIAGYWIGQRCGGDGWLSFSNTAPTGAWESNIARLKGSTDPNACPQLDSAFTRYRKEVGDVSFLTTTGIKVVSLPIVISEHYGGVSIGRAASLERVIFVENYGRAVWEAWRKSPPPSPVMVACPGVPVWSDPPGPEWHLWDRRCQTEIIKFPHPMSGDLYGWPPAGFVP